MPYNHLMLKNVQLFVYIDIKQAFNLLLKKEWTLPILQAAGGAVGLRLCSRGFFSVSMVVHKQKLSPKKERIFRCSCLEFERHVLQLRGNGAETHRGERLHHRLVRSVRSFLLCLLLSRVICAARASRASGLRG